MIESFLRGGCFHVKFRLMAASSIKRQFQESKLSNQQNREGRANARPSFKSLDACHASL